MRHLNTINSNLKLDTNIFVQKAENKEDLIRLFEIRWKGYSKYFNSRVALRIRQFNYFFEAKRKGE